MLAGRTKEKDNKAPERRKCERSAGNPNQLTACLSRFPLNAGKPSSTDKIHRKFNLSSIQRLAKTHLKINSAIPERESFPVHKINCFRNNITHKTFFLITFVKNRPTSKYLPIILAAVSQM